MSQTLSLFSKLAALFIIGSVLAGCSEVAPHRAVTDAFVDLAADNLPATAAEYRTTLSLEPTGHPHAADGSTAEQPVVWRFWREARQIVIERPQLGLGELWQRDGKTLIHRKLYHGDRRAIEFQEDDLKMLGGKPAWQKLALLIDPAVLERLTAGELDWLDDKPVREYRGSAAGADWRVVVRLDLALPVLIEREAHGVSERTELLNAYPLAAAPWQPTASGSYDVIDYADLGDKEYDPFVVKVQAQMGHDHSHSH